MKMNTVIENARDQVIHGLIYATLKLPNARVAYLGRVKSKKRMRPFQEKLGQLHSNYDPCVSHYNYY